MQHFCLLFCQNNLLYHPSYYRIVVFSFPSFRSEMRTMEKHHFRHFSFLFCFFVAFLCWNQKREYLFADVKEAKPQWRTHQTHADSRLWNRLQEEIKSETTEALTDLYMREGCFHPLPFCTSFILPGSCPLVANSCHLRPGAPTWPLAAWLTGREFGKNRGKTMHMTWGLTSCHQASGGGV